jgi:hypothetical protein
MKKNEILNNVFEKYLQERTETLEKSYKVHTENLVQSFKLIDHVNRVSNICSDYINEMILNSKKEMNKSFCSTSSKIFNNGGKNSVVGNDRTKTPIRRPSLMRSKSNTNRNDKSADRQKSTNKLVNAFGVKNSNINQNKTLKPNKSSVAIVGKSSMKPRESKDDRGISAENLKKSKTNYIYY